MALPLNDSLDRFKQNEERVQKFVNDPDGYVATTGEPVESIPAFLARVETEIEETTGTVEENLVASVAAKNAAEAARDASALNGRVYGTTAAGLAATTSGQYFSVPSADNDEYLVLYLNSSGAAVAVKTYPSSALVQQVLDYFLSTAGLNAFEFRDRNGVYSVAISKLGVLLARAAMVDSLEVSELVVRAETGGLYLIEIVDGDGNAVLRLRKDGVITMKALYDLAAADADLQGQIDALNSDTSTDVGMLTRAAWAALAFATEVSGSVNVIGDSISVGVGSSNYTTKSWFGLLKLAILGADGENLGGSTSVPHLTFYNNAVSGVTSQYFNNTGRLATITAQGGRGLYILAVGTNNIYNSGAHTTAAVYESDLNAIVDYLLAANAGNRVMLVVPPVAVESTWPPYYDHSLYAAAARRVARAKGCTLCDDRGIDLVGGAFYGDGVHPNDAGHYALFLNRLKAITQL